MGAIAGLEGGGGRGVWIDGLLMVSQSGGGWSLYFLFPLCSGGGLFSAIGFLGQGGANEGCSGWKGFGGLRGTAGAEGSAHLLSLRGRFPA